MMNVPLTIEETALTQIKEVMLASATEAFTKVGKQKVFPRYMTKKLACEYLDVSFNTLVKFIDLGLPVMQIDGITKLDKHDIDEFVQDHKI